MTDKYKDWRRSENVEDRRPAIRDYAAQRTQLRNALMGYSSPENVRRILKSYDKRNSAFQSLDEGGDEKIDMKRGGRTRYAEGGRTMWEKLAETWPAKAAQDFYNGVKAPGDALAGQFDSAQQPGAWSDEDEARRQANQGNIYSRANDLAGSAPAGAAFAPAMGATAPVFVGPFGAFMMRQADRMKGAKPHPVYGEEVKQATEHLRPEFQDIVKGAQTDMRDASARYALEGRAAAGNPQDRDIWAQSGWSRGAEGAAKKEIPDLGVKLIPFEGATGQFKLYHPAGDLHKIYDIPPIKFGGTPPRPGVRGHIDPDSGQIIVYGKSPTDPQVLSTALHEIQHAIQAKEGFGRGSNMEMERVFKTPEFQSEYFPRERFSDPTPSWQKEVREKAFLAPDDLIAARGAYRRSSGEVEARNVQGRRAQGYKYRQHPEDTEDITRGLQSVNTDHTFSAEKDKLKTGDYAKGGGLPWPSTGKSTVAPMSGFLKSNVPGRTDKLPINVQGGAYVLPADVVSALGQGNSDAGAEVANKMFAANKGPYGMNIPKSKMGVGRGKLAGKRRSALTKFADGGAAPGVDIVAAGGEYILSPDQVAGLGAGDVDKGHSVLDAFVKQVRDEHIQTLKKLPGPKGSK